MRDSLKTFLLRLLFLYPLCLAGWWALAGLQIETIASLASRALGILLPHAQITTQTQWETIRFFVQGVSGPVIDPLVLTRGLPIYLALMLAAPLDQKKCWGTIAGVLAIFAAAGVGFTAESAAEIVPITAQSALIPVAFIQIIAKSIATRVLPIGLWLWQQWAFLKRFLGPAAS